MATQQDIDSINGSDLMEYLRTIAPNHYRDLLEWNTALFYRGIITWDEYEQTAGESTVEEFHADLAALKQRCAEWLLAEPVIDYKLAENWDKVPAATDSYTEWSNRTGRNPIAGMR